MADPKKMYPSMSKDAKPKGDAAPAPAAKPAVDAPAPDAAVPAADPAADVSTRHADERTTLAKTHETERKDLHGAFRDQHRAMTDRHEAAIKMMNERQGMELTGMGAINPAAGEAAAAAPAKAASDKPVAE